MTARVIVAAALLLFAAGAQAGEKYYKWKDESGAWHYTRTPPPAGAQAENVEVKGGAGPSAGAAATPPSSSAPTPGASPTAGSAGAGTGNLSVAANADRKAQCEKARAYQATLAQNEYVASDTDGDGKPELLDEAQRERELERAAMAVKLACE